MRSKVSSRLSDYNEVNLKDIGHNASDDTNKISRIHEIVENMTHHDNCLPARKTEGRIRNSRKITDFRNEFHQYNTESHTGCSAIQY